MHTEITGTTHTFFGRPSTVYPTEYLPTLNTSITVSGQIPPDKYPPDIYPLDNNPRANTPRTYTHQNYQKRNIGNKSAFINNFILSIFITYYKHTYSKYQTCHIFFGWWVYVRGVFGTGGYCPVGICPGGICPRTFHNIQPYLHKVYARPKQNNLALNSNKTTHSVHSTSCRI